MKVVFVTNVTPATENIRGVSAHPYFLLKYRPKNIEVLMLTYNQNKMPDDYLKKLRSDLECQIEVLPEKQNIKRKKKISILYSRMITHYENPTKQIKDRISNFSPDIIWTYTNLYAHWARLMPEYKFVNSAPDSMTLLMERSFVDDFYKLSSLKKIVRLIKWRQYINTEKDYYSPNQIVHLVGLPDIYSYQKYIGANNAFFNIHPHYILKNKEIKFKEGRLRIVIAGRYDQYMRTGADDIVRVLIEDRKLISIIDLTFLGKKWEPIVSLLTEAGYVCKQVSWVDDYIEELIKYDIQLTPITLGTGTKAKVIDAMGNGLLCIGTPYAMENIHFENGKTAVQYQFAFELPAILKDIYVHKEKYENMARLGREEIRQYHNPTISSRNFFNTIKEKHNI